MQSGKTNNIKPDKRLPSHKSQFISIYQTKYKYNMCSCVSVGIIEIGIGVYISI